MLPPLLGLLLDCAKKTDQSVVSISLGALVHLIEVGGHQFSESDWDTLLTSIRDASYTTQPLELLNALGFVKNKTLINRTDSSSPKAVDNHQFGVNDDGVGPASNADGTGRTPEFNQQLGLQSLEGSEGLPSPSGRSSKSSEAGGLQRNQTIGQRIMGNMMDNLFLRSLTSKSKAGNASEVSVPSSPVKVSDAVEPDDKDEEESPLMTTVRGKCITQILLLGAIDSIQKKFWSKLMVPQKLVIMDILLSLLEFAASYNSHTNLRTRMHQLPDERPPLNLLRQELAGTTIYLDILQKSISGFDYNDDSSVTQHSKDEEKLEGLAEEKLVSFCEQVLREASDLQSSVGDTTNMDIHRVLELRSPVIIKVLKGMSFMNKKVFRRHLRDFYPLLTKLVCCDQMDVRGALGDLFKTQLMILLPS